MREALRLAQASIGQGGGPFGAVVVRQGLLVAAGHNRVTLDQDPTAHAEVVAIRRACAVLGHFQLDDCDIYSSCEPCPMCLGAIYWARPRRLYVAATREDAAAAGFDDQFIYDEIARPPDARHIPMQMLLREEALHVFRLWQDRPDKQPY
ncbi:MAG: guanine deaminase [Bacteroidia bacterium]